jgi:hypothetical protein
MSFLDDAKAAATMAIPGSGTPEPQRRVLDAMPIEELAGLWCSLQYLGMRDHTEEAWSNERDLQQENPDKLIDLILAFLKIESDPHVLSYLAAGPLEDVISARTIDRIEREAAANEDFRTLLRGAWYWNESHEIKHRLDAIIGVNNADA